MSTERYDWTTLRERYVTGTESLEEIANDVGTPEWQTLRHRSRREGWPDQREQYRHKVSTKTREQASSQEAETAGRHARIARALEEKALDTLEQLDPDTLTPYQLLAYFRASTQIERSALGMDTLRVQGEVEVDDLSMEQLKRIAAGEDPARVIGAE